MAQAGYTPISLYYSTTSSQQPLAADLTNGELAINITDGKLYYKDNAGVVKLLASNGASTPVTSISFGSTGLTPSTATSGAVSVAGTLNVGYGGTGQTSYTDGQLLIGNTATGGLSKATLTQGSGVTITNGNGTITIAATGSGGTVTSVGWTGGIVSVATATTTPAFTIAGTSGGIPYFSSGTTWASSGALAANAIVLGGGAGAAPATTTTGTGVVTAIGNAVNTANGLVTQTATLTASALLLGGGSGTGISSTTTGTGVVTALGINTGSVGAFVVNGGALGTPSSGTLSSCTVDGTNAVGYRNIPYVTDKTSTYNLATTDVGKVVGIGTGGSITIPDATFAAGDAVLLYNNTAANVTVTCSITTAYIAGTNTDKATVTLATRGVANVLFTSSTACVITGNVS